MSDIKILDACCGSRMFWFDKNMRVLKVGGTLVFKWSDCQINVKKLLEVIPFKPLFGQQRGTTHWLTFVKFEEEYN